MASHFWRGFGILGVTITIGAAPAHPGKPTAADYSRMRKETMGPAKANFEKERSAFLKKAIEKGRQHRLERNKQLKKEFLARWVKKVVNALKGDPKKLAAMNVSGTPAAGAGSGPTEAERAARKNVTVDGSGFPKEMEFQKPQTEEERLRELMKEEAAPPGTVEEGIHGQ